MYIKNFVSYVLKQFGPLMGFNIKMSTLLVFVSIFHGGEVEQLQTERNPKISKMEESKQQQLQQQQLLLQMQQQQQMQQRQQQLFLMQHLQKQHQQQAAMSMFPPNADAHLRSPGLIPNRPVNPFLQNANPNPNLIQQANKFQQQQQQQMMMMMMQQQQQKLMRPSNQLEIQFAYQDAWRVCHPDFKRPFASLEDACERLLPYHVVADYEAEEDDSIFDSNTTSQTLPRCQQWDNNIAAKVAEFTATFEEQVQAFDRIIQKRSDGDRVEERLMMEQVLLNDERNACIQLDREMKAQDARLRMAALAQAAGQARAEESQQSHAEMMARNPLRANAIGNHGEQGRNMNPNEMMLLMNGWGNNNNNNNSQKEEKEPLEDFLNDEENENGEHEKWRRSGDFDLNIR
ncbi:putative GLTSCR protein region [Arabidopsis thaliana]